MIMKLFWNGNEALFGEYGELISLRKVKNVKDNVPQKLFFLVLESKKLKRIPLFCFGGEIMNPKYMFQEGKVGEYLILFRSEELGPILYSVGVTLHPAKFGCRRASKNKVLGGKINGN